MTDWGEFITVHSRLTGATNYYFDVSDGCPIQAFHSVIGYWIIYGSNDRGDRGERFTDEELVSRLRELPITELTGMTP